MTLARAVVLAALVASACGGAADPSAAARTDPASVAASAAPSPAPSAASSGAAPSAPAATASASPAPTAASASPPVGARIDLHELPLGSADLSGTAASGTGVVLAAGTAGSWTSRWHEPGFAFSRLVPSWSADTPGASFIRVRVQGRTASGEETAWYSFGVWAYDDAAVPRSSSDGQRDRFGRIDTDTYLATTPLAAYRLRFELFRAAPDAPTPVVRSAWAVVSDPATIPTSSTCTAATCPLAGTGKDLAVPAYSQEIHAGEYPEFDGGGEAWCSPTSTAMVLAFWNAGPAPAETSWVPARYADPIVDHAARYTYDAAYGGTGNWPFNTAYASHYGLRAFVTQLRSLGEAERFIAAGIPLVASVKVAPGGLPGFLYAQGTNGHLLVIRGFTPAGDPIVNDPAATTNATVRRVYPRAAFEKAWLGGSGGTVYVIHPLTVRAPVQVPGSTPNW